jgi:hypothetical protein
MVEVNGHKPIRDVSENYADVTCCRKVCQMTVLIHISKLKVLPPAALAF